MATASRRTFLKQGAAAIAGLGAAAGPFGGLAARAANGPKWAQENGGYGPLVPIREADTGDVLLHLPAEFEYRLISLRGRPMSDGVPTPARGDGMAAFSVNGRTRIVRNHENLFQLPAFGPVDKAYDPRSGGGTTTLEVTKDRRVAADWVSLNGTNANCAGGPTPWGTWITCEETTNGPDANRTFLGTTIDLAQKHGYLFEVPASRGLGELVKGEPIRSAGRFAHEAVAIDQASGIVYQTEDDFAYASGLWRYIPPNRPFQDKHVADGGRLQILGVVPAGATGPVSIDLSRNQTVGATYRVAWIDIEDPDPVFPQGIENDPAARLVYLEGESKGAAKFSRLEGIDYFNRRIFVVSTQGGGPPFAGRPATGGFGDGWGQVWMYDIRSETLTLVFESPAQSVLDMPDNITISPRGKSVLLCEDSSGANFLRGLTQDGLLFDFALNAWVGNTGDEFAGATFSPDTQTLFVNMQATGATFAIWGPWQRGLL
jgi:secreted PhoX family phosphatase